MSEPINKEAVEGAVKAVIESEQVKEMTLPVSKRIGVFFDDAFTLVFGGWTHELAEKSRLKREKRIEDFKKKLFSDVEQIPDDNYVPPKESIVGPALEASKYYFEETEIRDMFEKLIVSSMDSRKISKVHPSYTEIIKQMTPLDAENLVLFNKRNILPIVEYQSTNPDDTYIPLKTNVFLENPNCQDLDLQSVSLESLKRNGLIEIVYDRYISIPSFYKKFEETEYYKTKQHIFSKSDKKITVQKGEAILTPVGQAFIDVCLS